jgi:hypothetical protein
VHPAQHCFVLAQGGFLMIEFTRSVIVHLSVGLAFFIFSLLIFERCCGNESAYSGQGGTPRRRWLWLGRRKRSVRHAIAWKDFNFVSGGRLSIVLRCVAYVIAVLMMKRSFEDTSDFREAAGFAWTWGLAMLHVELAIYSLLMWGPEAWGQHIGSLIGTPLTLWRINGEKLKALIIATIPSISMLLLAMAIGGSRFINTTVLGPFTRDYMGPWNIPAKYWFAIQLAQWVVHFALLLFLIVNLSLRLKWTALPAALGSFAVFQFVSRIGATLLLTKTRTISYWPLWGGMLTSLAALAVICFLFRNTHTLLLRRAAEG